MSQRPPPVHEAARRNRRPRWLQLAVCLFLAESGLADLPPPPTMGEGPSQLAGAVLSALAPAPALPPTTQDVEALSAKVDTMRTRLGILPRTVLSFELVGGAATLRQVNGGIRCPGANGMEPPGYLLHGSITLEDCAKMASVQPLVAGFRWGAGALNIEAYRRLAQPHLFTSTPLAEVYDLEAAFGDATNGTGFSCFIYMVNETTGHSPPFSEQGLNGETFEMKGTDAARVHHSMVGNREVVVAPTRNSGSEVCGQRYSVKRFLQATNNDLWFCYMPTAMRPVCEQRSQEDRQQAMMFLLVSVVMLLGVSRILEGNRHFVFLLEWVVRAVLTQELAFIAMIFLMSQGLDGSDIVLFSYGLVIVFIGAQAVQMPYAMLQRFEAAPTVVVFYLLFIVYTPSQFADWMSYYRPLPLLMDHIPRVLGLAGFVLEIAKHFVMGLFFPHTIDDLEEDHFCQAWVPNKAVDVHVYAPMQMRAECKPQVGGLPVLPLGTPRMGFSGVITPSATPRVLSGLMSSRAPLYSQR